MQGMSVCSRGGRWIPGHKVVGNAQTRIWASIPLISGWLLRGMLSVLTNDRPAHLRSTHCCIRAVYSAGADCIDTDNVKTRLLNLDDEYSTATRGRLSGFSNFSPTLADLTSYQGEDDKEPNHDEQASEDCFE